MKSGHEINPYVFEWLTNVLSSCIAVRVIEYSTHSILCYWKGNKMSDLLKIEFLLYCASISQVFESDQELWSKVEGKK